MKPVFTMNTYQLFNLETIGTWNVEWKKEIKRKAKDITPPRMVEENVHSR